MKINCSNTSYLTLSKSAILGLLLLLLPVWLSAATRTSTTAGGNWNSTSTWVGGVRPVAGDNVVIATTGTNAVTVDGIRTCVNLTINSRGRLIISGSNTLNVTGTVSMPRPAAGFTSELNVNAGILNVTGLFTMSATTGTRHAYLNITTGTANLAGLTTSGAASRIIFAGTGVLNLSGVLTGINHTLTADLGTVNFTGTAAQNVWGKTYHNLGISSSGVKTLAAHTTVTGIINITGELNLSNKDLILTGPGAPLVVGGTLTTATGSVVYAGETGQTVTEIPYFDLSFSGTGTKTIAAGTSIVVNRDWTIEGPALLEGTGNVDVTRNILGTGVLSMEEGTLTVGRNYFHEGSFNAGSGTVHYDGTVAQTIRIQEYYNLKLSASGSKTIETGEELLVDNDLEVGSNFTLVGTAAADVNGDIIGSGNIILQSGTIALEGDWMNEGNLESGTGTVVYNGPDDQLIRGQNYYNLETGEGGIKSVNDDVIVSNILTVGESSELDLLSHNLTLEGPGLTLINNGTFTPSASTVYYTNVAEAEIAPVNYHNLDCSGGPRKLSETGTIGISGLFTPGLGIFTVINSTVSFNGDDDQLIPQFTFHDVVLTGSSKKLIDSTVSVKTMKIETGAVLDLDSTGGGELVVTN